MRTALAMLLLICAGCDDRTPPPGASGIDASRDDAHVPIRDAGADATPRDAGSEPCTNAGDCDDALFCTGAEECDPSSPEADARGCVPGTSPCLAGQLCDEADGCVTTCAVAMDADGDGFVAMECDGDDCDDTLDTVHPGATELCDGLDDDCDGLLDGPEEDADADGHPSRACAGARGDDCDDSDPSTFVGADELCDGVDNDCSRGGGAEPADDMDSDGFAPADGSCTGGSLPATDCDDALAFVHPGAIETCDGRDDDCNGGVDEATDSMCAMPHSTSHCVAGLCVIQRCDAGFDDCSASAPGCEAELAVDEASCGACSTFCLDGATCSAGACSPRYAWDREASGVGTDRVDDLAVDATGNLYAAISGGSGMDLGGGPITLPSFGGAVIASFTSDGAHRYSHAITIGGTQAFARGVAVDAAGNAYLVGELSGSLTFASTTTPSAGQQDAFIAAYDASGAERWAHLFGSALEDDARGVAIDTAGNVYVTGIARGAIDFGGGARSAIGGADVFVASFTSDGAHRWSDIYGGSGDDAGRRIAADASVVVVGATIGAGASLGGSVLPFAGDADAAIALYDLSGAHQWSLSCGTSAFDDVGAIALVAGDAIVAAGQKGTAAMTCGGALTATSVGWVASFDATGAPLFGLPIEGTATSNSSLAPTPTGGFLIGASITGAARIADGRVITTAGDTLAELSPSGSSLVALGIGNYSTGSLQINATAGTAPGRVFVGGVLRRSLDFGGGVRSSDAPGDLAILALDF